MAVPRAGAQAAGPRAATQPWRRHLSPGGSDSKGTWRWLLRHSGPPAHTGKSIKTRKTGRRSHQLILPTESLTENYPGDRGGQWSALSGSQGGGPLASAAFTTVPLLPRGPAPAPPAR